jgi:hypothetical protein
MRFRALFILGTAALPLGCAAPPPQPAETWYPLPAAQAADDAIAASLMFDPPAAVNSLPPEALSREPRQRGALVGYEEATATFFYIRIDDRQTFDGFADHGRGGSRDRYERRAVSERVGTIFR